MALTKEERELLKEIREDQKVIREDQIVVNTVLLGTDGSPGLVKEVTDLAKGHGKLKRNFWILVGILVGSGVVGSGIYGVLNGG